MREWERESCDQSISNMILRTKSCIHVKAQRNGRSLLILFGELFPSKLISALKYDRTRLKQLKTH